MFENLNENKYFVSPDLSLCGFLCCFKYQIERIEKINGKAYFYILKNEKIDELIRRFWAHQAKVDPLAYFGFTKELKIRIFNNN